MFSQRCLPGNREDITGGGGRRHARNWEKCTVAEDPASAEALGQGGPRRRMQPAARTERGGGECCSQPSGQGPPGLCVSQSL